MTTAKVDCARLPGREASESDTDHRGAVVWLTGLPGSGKSSIAFAAEAQLLRDGFRVVVLDGDELRRGLCADLGFSVADRNENVRRVGEVARLFMRQGTVVLVALVSPVRSARDQLRQTFDAHDFMEVYCQCPLDVCRQRDPKGMYARAAQGLIPAFTGVSAPYEEPLAPTLTLNTAQEGLDASVERLTGLLLQHLRALGSKPPRSPATSIELPSSIRPA